MVPSNEIKLKKKSKMVNKVIDMVNSQDKVKKTKKKVVNKKEPRNVKNTSAAFLKLKERIRRVNKVSKDIKGGSEDDANDEDNDFVDIGPVDEDESTEKHEKLVQSIKSIKTRKSKDDANEHVEVRREPINKVSELNLTLNRYNEDDAEDATTKDGRQRKLNVKDLLTSAKDVSGFIDKSVKKLKKRKVIKPPLNDVESSLIERKTNHELVVKKVSKWQPIVDAHSAAPQLTFPLNTASLHMETTADAASRYQKGHRNEMERKIDELLASSKNNHSDDKLLTPAEEEYLKSLSLEEAQERHSQLQKMRALMSYQEAKLRRQKKIKSRNFHRILKKDKLKEAMKEFEELKEVDPERALEKLNELDKIRALERVTLRHKSTGRWAKHNKLRSKYDDNARAQLAEQVELSKVLMKKRKLEDDSDDDASNYKDANEDADMDPDADGDANAEDDENDLMIDNNYNPWMKTQKSVLEEKIKQKKMLQGDANEQKREDAVKKTPKTKDVKSSYYQRLQDLTDSDDDDADEDANQVKLISEAFADDDVVIDFEKEKKEVASEETPKDIDNFLPGWGSWTGPGINDGTNGTTVDTKMKGKREKFITKVPKIRRKDSNLGNVIISEKVNASIERLQVKQLPTGFKSVPEFESLISTPVGRTWQTPRSFQSLTEPSVVTKAGTMIDPMSYDSLAPFNSKKSYQKMKKLKKK